jgi:hypothetical protein
MFTVEMAVTSVNIGAASDSSNVSFRLYSTSKDDIYKTVPERDVRLLTRFFLRDRLKVLWDFIGGGYRERSSRMSGRSARIVLAG